MYEDDEEAMMVRGQRGNLANFEISNFTSAGLTNTSSSSNIVFPGGLPGTYQAQPCLASVGNQSWAAG